MEEIKTKNNTYIVTENLNTIITYNILGFEVITCNYYENEILVTIYDDECNCKAIATFSCVHNRYDYKLIKNIAEINDELLDEIMEQLYKITMETEWN